MTQPKLRAVQAAQYLGFSRTALAKWRMNGIGPAYHRYGPRIVYYYQSEIDRWLEECDAREQATRSALRKTKNR